MITFQSRNGTIRKADRITRHVNSVYPHISESRTRIFINQVIQKHTDNQNICNKLSGLKFKYEKKLDNLRFRGGYGIEQFRIIIDNLKNHKLGNCYESAVLAQIIGKINGLKNIYPAQIYFTKNNSKAIMQFDHAVAVVTDKPFEKDYKYQLKNKDAIIIDPWLGVTDFAGEYILKLKSLFIRKFPNQLSDDSRMLQLIAQDSKNTEEFNQKRKKCFKPDFYFKLHDDEVLLPEEALILKKEYPELIIK